MATAHPLRERTMAVAALAVALGAALGWAWPAAAADRSAVVSAEAQYSSARRNYEAARARAVAARGNAIREAQAKPEYQAALARVEKAHAGHKATKDKAVGALKASPAYQELQKGADAAQKKIEAARAAGGTPDVQAMNTLYNDKAKFTKQMKAMEDEAAGKAGASALQQEWREATRAVEAMDETIQAEAERTAEVQEAIKKMEELAPAVESAADQLASARASFNQAKKQDEAAQLQRFRESAFVDNGSSRYAGGWAPF